GNIIVDNFYELEMLKQLTKQRQQMTNILLRITPGVSADTHQYIMTGHADSNFGFDLQNGQAEPSLKEALEASYLNVEGLHMHIGSQSCDTYRCALSINLSLSHVNNWQKKYG